MVNVQYDGDTRQHYRGQHEAAETGMNAHEVVGL